MKPPPFAYAAAGSVEHALELLSGEDAVALAGGQSLVPLLNFRLARPSVLVDLNPLAELDHVRRSGEAVWIGALTRQSSLLGSPVVAGEVPLLAQAARHAGHPATRSRGTVGGSVAHADPRAELPVALVALGAILHLRSPAGERRLAAREFVRGPMMTALTTGELLCEIEVPLPPAGARSAFVEFARTHGGFASAGAAVVHLPGEHAAIALLGAGPAPVRATAAERALLNGTSPADVAALAVDGLARGHAAALLRWVLERALEQVAG